jgi:hypothetical protein
MVFIHFIRRYQFENTMTHLAKLVSGESKRAHAERVCSDRFSYISTPIGAFGTQINQPLVAQNWHNT